MDRELRTLLLLFYMLGYQRGFFNAGGPVENLTDAEIEDKFESVLLNHAGARNRLAHVQLIRTDT